MGFTGVVWASRDLRRLALDLINGAGAGPMGEAGETWVTVARELASIAEDYRALLDDLGEAWSSGGSDTVRHKLEAFGKWLDAAALNAATNAQRAESAAVAHGVAVLAMPTVPESVKMQEALAIGGSLDGYPNGLMVGALGATDAAVQAATADAVAIMNSYENSVTPLAGSWGQPHPPNIAKSAAQKAADKAKAAGGAKPGGGTGGAGVGAGTVPAPLGAFNGRTVQASAKREGARVVAASAGTTGTAGAPAGPMGAMGRAGNDEKEFESARPAASLSEAGEQRAPGSASLVAASHSGFSVDSVSWGPQTSTFAGPGGQAVPEEIFEPDSRQLEQASSDDWVSPSVIGERGQRV